MTTPLLSVRDLRLDYPAKRTFFQHGTPRAVQALAGIDLDIAAGETLALVGESGSGKSTLGRVLVRLNKPTVGSIEYNGAAISSLEGRHLQPYRRHLQMIFQDPYGSLNPRLTVGRSIAEPLVVQGIARGRKLREMVADCLQTVGLDPVMADRYPHAFSGGQRQRIAIARAIVAPISTNLPAFIVADEPLSALDVTAQMQIVSLFLDLKTRYALTYLFISHDLNLVRRIADRVAVMYLGKLVEVGPTHEVFAQPKHPYTQALLAAVPVPDPIAERTRVYRPLQGQPPSPADPPSGCRFHPRCPLAEDVCRWFRPPKIGVGEGHFASCHFVTNPSRLRTSP